MSDANEASLKDADGCKGLFRNSKSLVIFVIAYYPPGVLLLCLAIGKGYVDRARPCKAKRDH